MSGFAEFFCSAAILASDAESSTRQRDPIGEIVVGRALAEVEPEIGAFNKIVHDDSIYGPCDALKGHGAFREIAVFGNQGKSANRGAGENAQVRIDGAATGIDGYRTVGRRCPSPPDRPAVWIEVVLRLSRFPGRTEIAANH